MIRKAIIVVLTLATLTTLLAWAVSFKSISVGRGWHASRGFGFNARLGWNISFWQLETRNYLGVVAHEGTLEIASDFLLHTGSESKTPSRIHWAFGAFHFTRAPSPTRSSWSPDRLNSPALRGRPTCVVWDLLMPFWALLILFATYPTIAFIRGPACRWRRRRNGWCVGCGYDLTGNVSGVCPEYGENLAGRQGRVKGG